MNPTDSGTDAALKSPMNPDDYCQERAARSGSSFYYSFLFLPPPQRRAITALYAFCREVDDTVDEISDASVARAKLDWWREEVGRLFAGSPQHPVTRALVPAVRDYGVNKGRMLEIIAGMQMDLDQTRYLDFAQLRLYCHRVAGVVGSLSAGIFSPGRADLEAYADALGIALQLTNIIRDVGEDARRGRIYLPIEDLQRFGVPAHQILQAEHSEAFASMMRFQAQRARSYYRQAFASLPDDTRREQRAGLIMAAIYATLLEEIERDGFQVLSQRIALTPVRKLWLAWRTFTGARPPRIRPEA